VFGLIFYSPWLEFLAPLRNIGLECLNSCEVSFDRFIEVFQEILWYYFNYNLKTNQALIL